MLTPGQCAQLACVLEATARKPGNVTRFDDFEDLTYLDFVLSAAAIAPFMDRAVELGVGRSVLAALEATRGLVGTNSNLGMLLLLTPLAAVPPNEEIKSGVERVLHNLTIEDSRLVFAAIRLVNPGGLGEAPEQDVRGEPTLPLREVMSLAADRDSIARQYANGFHDVFEVGVRALADMLEQAPSVEAAVIECHLSFMAAFPDSHIVRRCGPEVGEASRRRAEQALNGQTTIEQLDAWLRADGNRRNPGTSADLVAASLFVALRQGMINFPLRF
jgi:triphosphoribosyl-dephospho-CoA synthase